MKKCSLLIKNAFVITMDGARRLIHNGVIAVDGEKIAAVGGAEVLQEYTANETVDAGGKIAFPGLVSTHTHSFQMLTRGLGRDKTLFDWLDSSVRRALRKYSDEYCYYAALASGMECMRTGTTTSLDFMYCQTQPGGFSDATIRGFRDAGIRTVYGRARTDSSGFPEAFRCNYVDTEQDFFDDIHRLAKTYAGDDMTRIALAPGIIWDVTEDGFKEIRRVADQYKLPITMHTLETEDDNNFTLSKYGMKLMPYLDKIGLLGPDFIAVHCVDMDDTDFELFRHHGIKVCHCPMANMILASGIAPIKRMVEEGICVSIGVDGASSNDTQNTLDGVRMASLLQKAASRDPEAVPAAKALEIGTLGGAEALGMQDKIGSIEVGKKADFVLFDAARIHTAPTHDPICAIVYNGNASNIDTVVVNGKVQIKNGEFCHLDEKAIVAKVQELGRKLAEEAGLTAQQWGQSIQF